MTLNLPYASNKVDKSTINGTVKVRYFKGTSKVLVRNFCSILAVLLMLSVVKAWHSSGKALSAILIL